MSRRFEGTIEVDVRNSTEDWGAFTQPDPVSFLMFGALVLVLSLGEVTWQVVVMVIVALTIARMIPVAIAMIGAGLAVPSLLYMGWFGPRGLATVVYAAPVVSGSQVEDFRRSPRLRWSPSA
jgi:hypothetical protein